MDARSASLSLVPAGLVPPGAPGTTGCPLVDWVLTDPHLAGAVCDNLSPRDVVGLRAACRAGAAAVAAHPWDWPARRDGLSSEAALGNGYACPTRTSMRRWRTCHPAARTVCVGPLRDEGDDTDGVTDGDVAAHCSGAVHVCLYGPCACLTNGCLAPLAGSVARLSLSALLQVTGACLAPLARRLERLHWGKGMGRLGDEHLRHLAGATRVHTLDVDGRHVSDAGVAHLSAVRDLTLFRARPDFTGAGLVACTRLESLVLLAFEGVGGPPLPLVPNAFTACARRLGALTLFGCDVPDAALHPLTGLTRSDIIGAPRLTGGAFAHARALTDLAVSDCPRFTGDLPAPAAGSVRRLTVGNCAAFTGAGLRGLTALETLAVTDCAGFTAPALVGTSFACPLLAHVTVLSAVDYGAGIDAVLAAMFDTNAAAAALGAGWTARLLSAECWTATRVLLPRVEVVDGGDGGGGDKGVRNDGGGGGGEARPATKRARTGS